MELTELESRSQKLRLSLALSGANFCHAPALCCYHQSWRYFAHDDVKR